MESVDLHVFGESSQDVFSAVAFLRARVKPLTLNEGTETQLAFIFGKARVGPKKALTIPKLKLQAALLAARLKNEMYLLSEPSCRPIVQLFFNGSI